MNGFAARTIVVPNQWDKDLETGIADNEGEAREILRVQQLAVSLLKTIKDKRATPERLAWMSFWTRTFAGLQAALAAGNYESEFALHVIGRACSELLLQVCTVVEPLRESDQSGANVSPDSRAAAWDQVMDRLRAYTAWCLWNDKRCLEEQADPSTLNGVWDERAARKMLSSSGGTQFLQQFGGEELLQEAINQAEPEAGARQEMDEGIRSRCEGVKILLSESALSDWVRRLDSYPRPPTFFKLFNEAEPRVDQRLGSLGLRFAYSGLYKRDSSWIHGSSIIEWFSFGKDCLIPRFGPLGGECDCLTKRIRSDLSHVVLYLSLMLNRVWQASD